MYLIMHNVMRDAEISDMQSDLIRAYVAHRFSSMTTTCCISISLLTLPFDAYRRGYPMTRE